MARELQTILLAVTATGRLKDLSEKIEHGKKILDFIGDIPEWINHNQNLEENLDFLKRKMLLLEHVQDDVKKQLENTELQSGKKRKREVEHWFKCVKKKVDDVKKVETAIHSVNYLPRFLFRAWLSSCIGDEIQQVTKLHEQGQFPDGLLLDAPQDGGELFLTSVLVGKTVSEKIGEVYSFIKDHPEVLRIGVQGNEGFGKTAIMMQVYNRLISSSSSRVYYVNLPQNFSTYSLQDMIASAMKVDIPRSEGSEILRAARIFNVLKSIKDYVLILDGLSRFFILEEIGIPVDSNGGKLVLTSRFSDVCRRMLCQKTVVLERLSREDSRTLFMEKLAAGIELSEEIIEVAGDIIQKCDGVASRIVDMSIQLRGVTDLNEWRNTVNEM